MTARTRSAWRDDYHATMNRLHRYMVPTQDGARRIPHHPTLVPLTNWLDRLELEGLEHGWLTLDTLTCTPKETEA